VGLSSGAIRGGQKRLAIWLQEEVGLLPDHVKGGGVTKKKGQGGERNSCEKGRLRSLQLRKKGQ